MKILMVFDGNGIGGAELQFMELANKLAKLHRVTLVSLHGDKAPAGGRLSGEVKVLSYTYASGKRALFKVLLAIGVGRAQRPDVIVGTSFIGNAVARAIQFGTARKLVSLQTVSAAPKYKAADRRILKSYDALVAGCTDIKDYLLEHDQDPGRICIVNNWVDFSARKITEGRSETRQRYGLPEDKTVIGCIGRMHHQKGQEYLIRAFRQISDTHSDVHLALVGDGPKMDEMRVEAGDHPRIVFTGTITGESYTNLLAAFDLYAQPSRFEGLPRTLLDAMYMQLPIVATAVNGNLDAMRDGNNGLTVPPEDPERLAAALTRLLEDPALCKTLSEQAARDALNHFSMEIQTSRIEEIIRTL